MLPVRIDIISGETGRKGPVVINIQPNLFVSPIQTVSPIEAQCCCIGAHTCLPRAKLPPLPHVTPQCRCGGSVRFTGTLSETLNSQHTCRCVQLFLVEPESSSVPCLLSETDRNATLALCAARDQTFYVHAPYRANLAGSFGVSSAAARSVAAHLNAIRGLPGAVVLHVGAKGGVQDVANKLNQLRADNVLVPNIHSRVPFSLLLETSAGCGTQLGRTWTEMRQLFEATDTTCVGLCVDTQHVFAAGMSNLQTHEEVVRLFDAAYNIVGKPISLLHLNDSETTACSRVDRHAPLTRGHIWATNTEGLSSLVDLAAQYNIDMISETSAPMADVALVQKLIRDKN